MSGSLRDDQTLEAVGRRLAEYDRRLRSVETLSPITAEAVNTVAAAGSTETLPEPAVATIHHVTLNANCTLTFPTLILGASFTLVLSQDGTGGRSVTWPSSVRWAAATPPSLTPTPNKRDVFSFMCADGVTWLGFVAGQAYS